MRLQAMPSPNSVWWAAILPAVAAALPCTISFLGTYASAKNPMIETATYSRPTLLPGFLANAMRSSLGDQPYVRGRCSKCSPPKQAAVVQVDVAGGRSPRQRDTTYNSPPRSPGAADCTAPSSPPALRPHALQS